MLLFLLIFFISHLSNVLALLPPLPCILPFFPLVGEVPHDLLCYELLVRVYSHFTCIDRNCHFCPSNEGLVLCFVVCCPELEVHGALETSSRRASYEYSCPASFHSTRSVDDYFSCAIFAFAFRCIGLCAKSFPSFSTTCTTLTDESDPTTYNISCCPTISGLNVGSLISCFFRLSNVSSHSFVHTT